METCESCGRKRPTFPWPVANDYGVLPRVDKINEVKRQLAVELAERDNYFDARDFDSMNITQQHIQELREYLKHLEAGEDF